VYTFCSNVASCSEKGKICRHEAATPHMERGLEDGLCRTAIAEAAWRQPAFKVRAINLLKVLMKVLNATEDTHLRSMSTFEGDEHLRELSPIHCSAL
jgi:hypothetical protein